MAGQDEERREVHSDPITRLFLALVRGYQRYISPLLPPSCIYSPTCSEYARIAIGRYGFLKGGWLAVKRICRCHPLHKGGYDPVP